QDTVQAALEALKAGAGTNVNFYGASYMRNEDQFAEAYEERARRQRKVGLGATPSAAVVMAETFAPDFVTPPSGVRRMPVTSIVPTGLPLDEGIKLFLNQDGYGFILEKESEGLWLSPVENTVTASSRGGGTLRNRRWAEGDSFLVLS